MLKGRLGLDSARVPHKDRAGLLYLARGALTARDGTLAFQRGDATAADALAPGDYAIPLQGVSMILLGPGSTVSHDALRLLAHARTALAAVGEDGVRFYTAPPLIPDRSGLARRQAQLWADEKQRLAMARRMYALRLGRVLPHRSLDVLRGIEGARMKESYRLLARQIGVEWSGRRYDHARPLAADLPNQALNHASSAVEGAAAIAVAATARSRSWVSFMKIPGSPSSWTSPTSTGTPSRSRALSALPSGQPRASTRTSSASAVA